MFAIRRALAAGVATLVFAGACSSITVPTIPPINIPTFPPINLPGGVPTIPPIGVPGGETGTTPCSLVTAAEVGQIMGATVSDASNSSTDCTFITSSFETVSVSTDDSSDLTGAGYVLGTSAQSFTVAGLQALRGTALGFPAVYVQKGGTQLTVLGFLLNNDLTTTLDHLTQIATIAVGRMP